MEDKYRIYILLTNSGSLLSKCIKKYKNKPYTHVSVAFDIELEDLYSFGRKKPMNPVYAGFVKEDVVNGTYARFPKTTCAIYYLEVDKGQYEKLKKEMHKFIENGNKYRYNLVGLFGVIFNFPIERKYNYFCSQFVSEILTNSGIKLIDKPVGLTAPNDFRECEDLNLMYEGELRQYNFARC